MQSFWRDVVEKASFLVEWESDDSRVATEESRVLSQRRSHSLSDPVTKEAMHLYNVCVALMKKKQVLRCCVLWAQFWGIDVPLVGSEQWVEERKEQQRQVKMNGSRVTKRFLAFDACVVDCWRCLLRKDRVMAEVLAMESCVALYHTEWVCLFESVLCGSLSCSCFLVLFMELHYVTSRDCHTTSLHSYNYHTPSFNRTHTACSTKRGLLKEQLVSNQPQHGEHRREAHHRGEGPIPTLHCHTPTTHTSLHFTLVHRIMPCDDCEITTDCLSLTLAAHGRDTVITRYPFSSVARVCTSSLSVSP